MIVCMEGVGESASKEHITATQFTMILSCVHQAELKFNFLNISVIVKKKNSYCDSSVCSQCSFYKYAYFSLFHFSALHGGVQH